MFSCEKKNPVRKWSAVCMNSHVQKATFARKGAMQISGNIAMLSEFVLQATWKINRWNVPSSGKQQKYFSPNAAVLPGYMHSNSALSDSDILTTCRNCTMVIVLRVINVRPFKNKTVQYKKQKLFKHVPFWTKNQNIWNCKVIQEDIIANALALLNRW